MRWIIFSTDFESCSYIVIKFKGQCIPRTFNIYILLTKREGRTGRISAEVLTVRTEKRPSSDILPVRSGASLVK